MLILIIIISVVISVLLSLGWLRINSNIELSSEAFRDATKLGITITTLIIPLLLASSARFSGSKLWQIFVMFTISTTFGLWNSFSLATLTTHDGKIIISPRKNKLMPLLLVIQFVFMIAGIAMVVVFFEKGSKTEKKPETFVLNSESFIGKSKRDIIKYKGIPDSIKVCNNITKLMYNKEATIVTYQVTNDTIIKLNEQQITGDRRNNH